MSADTAVAMRETDKSSSAASKAVKIVSLQAPTTERSLRQRTQSPGAAQTRLDYRNRPGNRSNHGRQLQHIISQGNPLIFNFGQVASSTLSVIVLTLINITRVCFALYGQDTRT